LFKKWNKSNSYNAEIIFNSLLKTLKIFLALYFRILMGQDTDCKFEQIATVSCTQKVKYYMREEEKGKVIYEYSIIYKDQSLRL
jgi:hypothetical protein